MVALLHKIATNDVKTIMVIIVVITVMSVMIVMNGKYMCIALLDIMVFMLQ